jgi:hypothetical protein
MRLKDWLELNEVKPARFAAQIGVHRSLVSRYVNRGAVPQPDVMRQIFVVTCGAVTPDDFHDLPELSPAPSEAAAQ